jgi:hypothetical protein
MILHASILAGLMKIHRHTPLLALLFVSGILNAQTTVPPVGTPVTVQGNVEIRLPDAPAVSEGTAPAPSDPILNVGPGATSSGIPNLIHTYSTNGEGTQNQVATTNGGILAEANGNLTLSRTETTQQTATYTIETRELKVSSTTGFTDTAGTYGPAGTFYPNGTTLPGTAVDVATVRDTDGKLLSVISDIPGVGPVTSVDTNGFPILTPAQISAAVASGSAPAGFFTEADPVVTDGTGNLNVEGNADVDGTLSVGAVADVEATLGGLQTEIDAEEIARADADTALQAEIDAEEITRADADTALQAEIDAEEIARADADTALQAEIDAEEITRADADTALQAEIDAEEITRADADTALQAEIDAEEIARADADTALQAEIDAEEIARADADTALGSRIDAEEIARADADISIRTDFAAADSVERNARIAADNTLGARIDTEVSSRIAGDTALGLRINDEQSARIAADNALNIRIDDTNLRVTNEVNRLDGRINGVAAGLATETNNRIAADNALRAGIDENTRGIAMVAAMTNTRVEAGKTHGVDFNMAQFQSETGFAFGYANRLNDTVQLHGSVASTTDFDESVVRVGVAVQW